MKHIRNTSKYGLYTNITGKVITGPKLVKSMAKTSFQQKYENGSTTLEQTPIMNRPFEEILLKQSINT